MRPLTGLIVVRNHLTYDYIPEIAAISLLPACDQVFIVDMESDDGSAGVLHTFCDRTPRTKFFSQKWHSPHNRPTWWVEAINEARKPIPHNHWLLHLDADEVLGDESVEVVKAVRNGGLTDGQPVLFRRINFWKDAHHLAPEDRFCGTMVARMGPANVYLPSDEQFPAVEPNMRTNAQAVTNAHIYHYGAIRDRKKFVEKSVATQNYFFGSCDKRITDTAAAGKPWDSIDYFDLPLRDFAGTHPQCAIGWLKERGNL